MKLSRKALVKISNPADNKVRLNLGCGKDYKEGYVNIDNRYDFPNTKVDVNHNLDKFPYPFESDSVDMIFFSNVLEHLERPREVLQECHRILKKDGELVLIVPYFSRGYMVHLHFHGFSKWSVLEDTKEIFHAKKVRFVWDDPNEVGIFRYFCIFWNWFLNKNHWFTERFLAYSFGGIQQIEFLLVKK